MAEKTKSSESAVTADAMVESKPAASSTSTTTAATPAAKNNSTRNLLLILGGCLVALICFAVVVLVVVPAVTIGGLSTIGNKIANDVEKSQDVNKDAYNRPSRIGDIVKVGNIEWQVTKVTNLGDTLPSSSQYLQDVTNKDVKFIRIEFTANNTGNKETSILSLNVVDDQGKTYSLSGNTYLTLKTGEQSSVFANLKPDIKESFIDIYEVPKDAKGLRFEVTDLNLLTPQKAYVDLGL